MRLILSILCCAVILFVGGCVVTIGQGGGPIAWASWAVVAVNLLMIVALWAMPGQVRPLFTAMGVLDFAVALILGVVLLAEFSNDSEVLSWGLVIAAAFLVKAGLSFKVAKQV